jgi:MATE family multidrug resistance protein
MRSSVTLPAARAAGTAALWHELRAMLALALPLALTQIAQVLVHTTEVVLLGRLSAQALAAASLGAALFHTGFMFAVGVVSATAPLIALAKGARKPRALRRAVRQGLWVTLALSLPLGLLLALTARPLLALMGQDPHLLPLTEAYVRMAVLGLPFGVGFIVLRSFTSAFGKTSAVLWATLFAVTLNVPFSWAVIFGHLGLPAMGTMGAGLGVAVTYALMFLALLLYSLSAKPFRRFAILGRFLRPDWQTFREILKVGVPIGGTLLMEVGIFATSALLMGLIGTESLAAHQVTVQIASTAFMVPLGISHAATIRVGLAEGARDRTGVRRAGFTALGLGTAFMGATGLLFWFSAEHLVGLFFAADAPGAAEAIVLASSFLRVAALFQLVDGMQVIGIANLRGFKDTRVPMGLAAFGYWVVGFPTCILLGFYTPLGGIGIWMGLAVALSVVAVMVVWRFERLTRARR